jgi:tetratricopeptide (TPR) repeat protein
MKDYRPMAEAAARRARELDPSCAEAYAVSAELKAVAGDPAGAEVDFKKAIELSPSQPTAYQWYGRFLNSQHRGKESLIHLRKAVELDPLSPVIQSTIPEYYYLGGDYETAVREARKVIELFPDFIMIRRVLVAAQLLSGSYADALKEIDLLRALQPDNPRADLDLKAYAFARMGRQADARRLLAETEALREEGKPLEGQLLLMYLGLGEREKAVDLIEQASVKGEMEGNYEHDPFLQELRGNPRFDRLASRMKAPPSD